MTLKNALPSVAETAAVCVPFVADSILFVAVPSRTCLAAGICVSVFIRLVSKATKSVLIIIMSSGVTISGF